ncbi:unnamed protein product [Colias eurytheme]|nr:unnamed protein product [Colias eurytheme]
MNGKDIRKSLECERAIDRNVKVTYLLEKSSSLVTYYRARNVTRKRDRRCKRVAAMVRRRELQLHRTLQGVVHFEQARLLRPPICPVPHFPALLLMQL